MGTKFFHKHGFLIKLSFNCQMKTWSEKKAVLFSKTQTSIIKWEKTSRADEPTYYLKAAAVGAKQTIKDKPLGRPVLDHNL